MNNIRTKTSKYGLILVCVLSLILADYIYEYGRQVYYDLDSLTPSLARDFSPRAVTRYFYVSHYAKTETCPTSTCRTASGRIATKGVSAACPRSISLGTKIRINKNTYSCDDRTARRYGYRIDLYEGETYQDYVRATKQGVTLEKVTIYL